MALENPNFNSIAATTYKKFKPTIIDNITDHQIILFEIKRRGGINMVDGGERLVCPVELVESGNFASYAQFDEFDMTPADPFTAAEYQMKQFRSIVSISGFDQWRNSARREQIIPLLKNLTRNAKQSMKLGFSQQIMTSDGTTNIGKDLGGLPLLVDDDGTFGEVGGIDSNVTTRWRNQRLGSVGSASANFRTKILSLMNSQRVGGAEKPHLLVTAQGVHEQVVLSLYQTERYSLERRNENLVNAGFTDHILINDVPFMWDTDCESDLCYSLNFDTMYLWIGTGHDFEMTEFVRPNNQDAQSAAILTYAQMGVGARNQQGVLDGLT